MTPKSLAERVKALISLPDVAIRINEALRDENSNNHDLEAVILHDPALTARLLKIVNSAYYGFPRKIDTISRAVVMVGRRDLSNLVLATAVSDSFKGIPGDLVDMNSFWYHSVTSGILARLLAQRRNHVDLERFFIAGLLHCIGKLVLFSEFPEQSAAILALKDEGEDAITAKERETFGFSHVEVGAELLKQWGLPESICHMIAHHLQPELAAKAAEDAYILHLATYIADRLEPCAKQADDFSEPELDYALPVFSVLGFSELDIRPLIQEAAFQAFEVLAFIRPEATLIF